MWIKNVFLLFSVSVPGDHCSRGVCVSGDHRRICADDRKNEDEKAYYAL